MIASRITAFAARQSSYSVVCAATALLFFLTASLHVIWSQKSFQDQAYTVIVALVSALFVMLPLAFGSRYPRQLGVLGTSLALVCVNLTAAWSTSPVLVLNAILLLPVIAITCGWFFPRRYARPVMLVGVAIFTVLLSMRSRYIELPAPSVTTIIYTALITGFLFETGVYLHRRTDQRASHDPLTGALNRFGFWRDAGVELQRAHRSGAALTVVVIDFDNFKGLNDTSGHLAGDIVLRQALVDWRAGLRPYDLIVRLGGDEFGLLFPGIDADGARRAVERLRERSAFSWSWGIAQWRSGESLESLLDRADAEMLRSRSSAA